jgi:small subunit ribosomal protein S21
MRKSDKKSTKNKYDIEASGPPEFDYSYFTPLQVIVGDNFDRAFKIFKSAVQQDKILALYKQKQAFEKPSVKKRRKRNESLKRTTDADLKQRKILSGEYDKEKKKKLDMKERKKREQDQINKKVLD